LLTYPDPIQKLIKREGAMKFKKMGGETIDVQGEIKQARVLITKTGKDVCFATLKLNEGEFEFIFFPDAYEEKKDEIIIGKTIELSATVEVNDEDEVKFLV
jgi:DNA polymerase III alpha subunit